MSELNWEICYELLKQYGSRDAIPQAEIAYANRQNPNHTLSAWNLAARKFIEAKQLERRYNEATAETKKETKMNQPNKQGPQMIVVGPPSKRAPAKDEFPIIKISDTGVFSVEADDVEKIGKLAGMPATADIAEILSIIDAVVCPEPHEFRDNLRKAIRTGEVLVDYGQENKHE